MKKLLIVILYIFVFINSFSQPLITVEDAIDIALKNNFNILIARNDADINKINNTLGNAGMLPGISINGSNNYSSNNVDQKYSTGSEITANNAYTNSFNSGVALNWTLFDGGKMFVTKNKLNEIQALGEIQYKDKVMQLVYDVVLAYYDVVRQKQQLSSINEVITYNLERVKILDVSFGAGLTPKTNLLQAKIDLNVYQENAIDQKTVISLSKRYLNQLLSRNATVDFEVADSIPLSYNPDQQKLTQRIDSVNTNILAFQKQVDVARLSVREYNALLLPKLNASAGYNFLQTNNEVGSLLRNRANGPQFGASISIPIFQGGNAMRQIKMARIQLQSTQLNFENIKIQVNTQLQNALTEFENQQHLLSIEKDNVILAKENLDITMQRLRYGQTTSLEVRLAQDSYEQSLTRLLNFKFNLKAAETKLKQLMAEL
jgi:outer membrane protein